MLQHDARFLYEISIMNQYLPHYIFFDPDYAGIINVIGHESSPDFSHDYTLLLKLTPGYPNKEPFLFVSQPLWLCDRWGNLIQADSHDYHTHQRTQDGMLNLCYTINWDPSWTCHGILTRGIVWLCAYESHLKDGASIDYHIQEIERGLR